MTGVGYDAVVAGGGLAGLLTVGALLGRAGSVALVERDRYPDGPVFRKGVPQARHAHVLLTGGQQAMDELLPGAVQALVDAGARRIAIPRDMLTLMASGWQRRRHDPRHCMLSVTRPLLDTVVRRLVLAAAEGSGTRLEVLQETEAVGLLGAAGRVTGLRVRTRGGAAPAERELAADLVVDATGRSSAAPAWLAEIGCPAPREESVDAGLAYATRVFRPDQELAPAVFMQPRPDCPRGAAYLPVEDGRWLLSLYGVGGHHPPTEPEAFLDFTTTLAHPLVYERAKASEPLSPVHGFRGTSNRRRHFDAPGAAPDGFLVLGDALCTFNPIYGQGMSVAALGALALRDSLDGAGGLGGPGGSGAGTAAAQRAVARTADAAWLTASGADRPHAEGPQARPGPGERLINRYLARLMDRAAYDPVIGAVYRDVFSLTAPPSRLLAPGVALRTLLLPRRPGLTEPPYTVEDDDI
jgi:2-polyprenyl-6-methoxyphenol hydroxylase-like FAD-dependent oxidoreductase